MGTTSIAAIYAKVIRQVMIMDYGIVMSVHMMCVLIVYNDTRYLIYFIILMREIKKEIIKGWRML